jgi:hypothetical protein
MLRDAITRAGDLGQCQGMPKSLTFADCFGHEILDETEKWMRVTAHAIVKDYEIGSYAATLTDSALTILLPHLNNPWENCSSPNEHQEGFESIWRVWSRSRGQGTETTGLSQHY